MGIVSECNLHWSSCWRPDQPLLEPRSPNSPQGAIQTSPRQLVVLAGVRVLPGARQEGKGSPPHRPHGLVVSLRPLPLPLPFAPRASGLSFLGRDCICRP